MSVADTGSILTKGDIKTQWSWFQCPSGHGWTSHHGIAGQRTQIKLDFTGGLIPKVPDSDHHHDRLQAQPLRLLIQVADGGYRTAQIWRCSRR
jgi:hypothetical protein